MTPEEVRFRDHGHAFSCVRCKQHVSGLHGTPEHARASLASLGWLPVGESWACSSTCLAWLRATVSEKARTEIGAKGVQSLDDDFYQKRRAAAVSAPPRK